MRNHWIEDERERHRKAVEDRSLREYRTWMRTDKLKDHQGEGHGITHTESGWFDGMIMVCSCGERIMVTGMEMAVFGLK